MALPSRVRSSRVSRVTRGLFDGANGTHTASELPAMFRISMKRRAEAARMPWRRRKQRPDSRKRESVKKTSGQRPSVEKKTTPTRFEHAARNTVERCPLYFSSSSALNSVSHALLALNGRKSPPWNNSRSRNRKLYLPPKSFLLQVAASASSEIELPNKYCESIFKTVRRQTRTINVSQSERC